MPEQIRIESNGERRLVILGRLDRGDARARQMAGVAATDVSPTTVAFTKQFLHEFLDSGDRLGTAKHPRNRITRTGDRPGPL